MAGFGSGAFGYGSFGGVYDVAPTGPVAIPPPPPGQSPGETTVGGFGAGPFGYTPFGGTIAAADAVIPGQSPAAGETFQSPVSVAVADSVQGRIFDAIVATLRAGIPGLIAAWQIEDTAVEPAGYPAALVFKTDERPFDQTNTSELVRVAYTIRVWTQAGDERTRSLQQVAIGEFITQAFDNQSIAGLTGEALTERVRARPGKLLSGQDTVRIVQHECVFVYLRRYPARAAG